MSCWTFLLAAVLVGMTAAALALTIFNEKEEEKIARSILRILGFCGIISIVLVLATVLSPSDPVWDYDDTKQYQLVPLTDWYKYASVSTDKMVLDDGNTYYFEIYSRSSILNSFSIEEYAIPSDQVDIEFRDGYGRLVITQPHVVRRKHFLFLYLESDDEIGQPTYALIVPKDSIMNTQPQYD